MATDRTSPSLTGLDERSSLGAWLDYHRATLLWKVDGLTDEQLLTASTPPSPLNLMGLLRHMADNEVWWFSAVLAGEEVPASEYPSGGPVDDTPDADLLPRADESIDRIRPLFVAACERSRQVFTRVPSLDETGDLRGTPVSARWVATHMLEEYARHNGHADLLREALDGATGE